MLLFHLLDHNIRTTGIRRRGGSKIRLQVDNEVEVPVRRDVVTLHTTAGRPARDDGSECNAPLLFTGTVMGREGAQYKADVVTEDGRLHAPCTLASAAATKSRLSASKARTGSGNCG